MTMPIELDEVKARRWLRGQQAAARQVEEERVRYLLHVTPQESLDTYLQLLQVAPGHVGVVAEPSQMLLAMRRLLDRFVRQQEKLA
jgi:hypothetical protein